LSSKGVKTSEAGDSQQAQTLAIQMDSPVHDNALPHSATPSVQAIRLLKFDLFHTPHIGRT